MSNAPFIPKSDAVWDKFCTQIRVATQAEKIINAKILIGKHKIKKKEYEAEHA
jgi:hypothetical protein